MILIGTLRFLEVNWAVLAVGNVVIVYATVNLSSASLISDYVRLKF